MYRTFFRPLLFRLPPEQAHMLTVQLLRLSGKLKPAGWLLQALFSGPDSPVQVFGLQFRNPVGLAAGYDKDGLAWRGLAHMGFGHLELGTVTPRPQPGNPQPRLFRLPEDQGLINRMGFPGHGAAYLKYRLTGPHPQRLVLGVNLGKNKDTPLELAIEDYLVLLRDFAPLADYLAINVSSPNTIGLRQLQGREYLFTLLQTLENERRSLVGLTRRIPLLVKLAPDLTENELEDALDAITSTGMDGVIATNTTLQRNGLASQHAQETGGLSGAPLENLSTQNITRIFSLTGGKLPIIGVGGIYDANSARRKLDAGATLIQIYTGLVYAGPGLVKQILQDMATRP
jgi:dihydroorotate dehydrogenase